MSFLHPILLLTLLSIPVAAGLYLLAERRRARYAVRFTNLDVLAAVVGGGRRWRRYAAPSLLALALAALCVALARPRISRLVPTDRATVILVVDASGSMQASDVKPTRLIAAERAVNRFIDRAPKQLRIGLIVFAGEPQVAAPPTTDHALVRASLQRLDTFPGFGGTAIGDALAMAVQLGRRAIGLGSSNRNLASALVDPSPRRRSLVSIVFLSDGTQTRGALQPLQGADRAKESGFPVYTVALGTPGGMLHRGFGIFSRPIPVPPDPKTLRAIAQRTGGRFVDARSSQTLTQAYSRLGSAFGRRPGHTEITFAFLLGAIGLLIAAGAVSALWSPRLP